MNFNVEEVSKSERKLLFALAEIDPFAERRIGHVRGDFGSGGAEFHHTWWPQHDELNTQSFKDELKTVVDELRSDSCLLLKNRRCMQGYCLERPNAKVAEHWNSETYGFKICTERYMYYIRAFYGSGDYNFYINCFVRDTEMKQDFMKAEE